MLRLHLNYVNSVNLIRPSYLYCYIDLTAIGCFIFCTITYGMVRSDIPKKDHVPLAPQMMTRRCKKAILYILVFNTDVKHAMCYSNLLMSGFGDPDHRMAIFPPVGKAFFEVKRFVPLVEPP